MKSSKLILGYILLVMVFSLFSHQNIITDSDKIGEDMADLPVSAAENVWKWKDATPSSWAWTLPGCDPVDFVKVGLGITDTHVYVVCANGGELLLISLDWYGQVEWDTTLDNLYNYDPQGICMAGDYLYTVSTVQETSGAKWNVSYSKFEKSNGNHLWTETWGGSGNDYGFDIQAGTYLSDSGFYVVGGTASFSANAIDSFLLRIDTAGEVQEEFFWEDSSIVSQPSEIGYALCVNNEWPFWDVYVAVNGGSYLDYTQDSTTVLIYQTALLGESTTAIGEVNFPTLKEPREIVKSIDASDELFFIAGENSIACVNMTSEEVIWNENIGGDSIEFSILENSKELVVGYSTGGFSGSYGNLHVSIFDRDTGEPLGEIDEEDIDGATIGGRVLWGVSDYNSEDYYLLAEDEGIMRRIQIHKGLSDNASIELRGNDFPYQIFYTSLDSTMSAGFNLDMGTDSGDFIILHNEDGIVAEGSTSEDVSLIVNENSPDYTVIVYAEDSYSSRIGTLQIDAVEDETSINEIDSIYWSSTGQDALNGAFTTADQAVFMATLTVSDSSSAPIFFLADGNDKPLPKIQIYTSTFDEITTGFSDNSAILQYIERDWTAGTYYIVFTPQSGKTVGDYDGEFMDFISSEFSIDYLSYSDMPEALIPKEESSIPGYNLWIVISPIGLFVFWMVKRRQ